MHDEPTLSILIVDDATEDCITYQRYLMRDPAWRYECAVANTGHAALAYCQTQRPACVLLDYSLPDMNGLEVLEALQQLSPTAPCPVVMLTGTDDVELAVRMMKAGVQDFINKNRTTPPDLQRAVHNAIERARLRRELEESEARFRSFAEQISQVVWFIELNPRRVIYVSPAFETIWGVPTTELYTDPLRWLASIHPDDLPRVEQAFSNWISGLSASYDEEFRIITPTGHLRWVRDRSVARHTEGDTPVRISGIADDITLRKTSEAALAASERRFRLLSEAIPQLVWTCDETGNCDYLNNRWLAYTGQTLTGSLGKTWLAVVHPDDVAAAQTVWTQAVATGQVYEAEFRMRRADGVYRWHLGRAVPYKETDGEITKWFGTNTDIEDRKQDELNRERLAAIVEFSEDAILTLSMEGRVTSWNAGAERLFGYSATEILDHPSTILSPPAQQFECHQVIEQIAQGEHLRHFETVRMTKDGRLLDVSLSFSPLRDATGKIVGISTIVRDISQRKQAEQERELLLNREQRARKQAESANRLKDDFLATVSHELRTPLSHMYGWVKLLRNNSLSAAETERALETIERNMNAQKSLIEDLLDVSRIITGKMRLDVRAFPLPAVVESAIESIRPAAEAKGVRLQVIVDPRSHTISGDPERLQQIVWNLLSNAIKFTSKNGRVQIRIERHNSDVHIVISDTGLGIDPEFLPYIFERFRQQDSSRGRQQGGLGLGLAIVRHLTELHGGKVSAESPGLGQGATFRVELPLAVTHSLPPDLNDRHPAVTSNISLPQNQRLKGVRVLIVDDDADSLALLEVVLQPTGAELRQAQNMQAALDILEIWRAHVLVSDIGMPEGDGYELMRRVRQMCNAEKFWLPAVALTAYASAEDRMMALAAGFQMHVTKPVEPAELITVVASLAGRLN